MDRPELARQRVPLEAFEAEEAARPLDRVDRPEDAAQEREVVRPLLERQHLLLQPRQVLIALDEKLPDEIESLVVVHYLPQGAAD